MSVLTLVNWDMSCLTVRLDGQHFVAGVQSINLGDGLEPGKSVYQAGRIGPMSYTKPLFKGDGNYSIKMLADGFSLFQDYLIQKGGLAAPELLNSVKCNVRATLERDGFLFEVECFNCQFLTPTIDGLTSPDSRDPLTCEVKFTCTNRAINGIKDWDDR